MAVPDQEKGRQIAWGSRVATVTIDRQRISMKVVSVTATSPADLPEHVVAAAVIQLRG